MISTVKITKTVDAMVPVEHPDDATEADVMELVKLRAFDLAPRISWWEASESTEPTKVYLGVYEPDEHDMGGCCMPSAPEPFDLMGEEDPTTPEDE